MSPSVRIIPKILFFCLLGLAGAGSSLASNLTVEWDANTTDSDLAGYRIYMTTDPAVLALPPSQAAAQATTRDVDAATTSSVFTGLDPNLTYWFGVTAFDTSGNESIFSNIASGTPNDITAPVVSITSPSDGATVSDSISVTATASDDVGVAGVRFLLDGAPLGPEDTSAPYMAAWDTTTAADGAHTLTAVARDAAGNSTTSDSVTVTVANADTTPPAVSITSPSSGETLWGTVSITADASDDEGVSGVRFLLNGAPLGPEDTSAPYMTVWDTTTASDGSHTLTAVARDAAGNTTTSAAVTVSVDNPDTSDPTVSITSPASGATVNGTITITADAADDEGVAGVRFFVDGSPVGAEDTSSPWSVSWDTTTASDGPHTLTAVARDAAGNTATSAAVTVTVDNPDTTDPTVSITFPSTGATVSGTITITADAADDEGVAGVRFFVDGSPVGAEDTSSPWSVSWDTTTASDGAHTLTAVARDAAGNTTTSEPVFLTVANADTTPPTVTITVPSAGSTVAGSVQITADAADDEGVVGVRFRVDGVDVGAEDTASPWQRTWDTTTVANGTHTLTAVARDAAGNTTTSQPVTVTVANADTTPPMVTMTLPSSGATVSGSVSVSATASDDVGVAGVQFRLDGGNLGSEVTSPPYNVTWDTTGVSNGAHTLTAIARDAAGNTTTAGSITVMVDNADTTPPTVSITSPANDASVSGTVTLTAVAADNVGVTGVRFRVNGADVGSEDTTSPYSVSWDTTGVANGTYTITAIARDAAGNSTTAAPITVTVNNADTTPPAPPGNVRVRP